LEEVAVDASTAVSAFVVAAKTTTAATTMATSVGGVGMAATATTTAFRGNIDRGLGSPTMHLLALLVGGQLSVELVDGDQFDPRCHRGHDV
jgi:hypothetical protein